MKFYIHTYGCQMNVRDSEAVESLMIAAGHEKAASEDDAEVVIINSCTVRQKAEEKAVGKSGNMIAAGKITGMMGCAVKRMGEDIFKRLPKLHFAVGPRAFGLIPKIVSEGRYPVLELGEDVVPVGMDAHVDTGWQSFVTVLLGCDNRCSYCIVPYVRGRERSRLREDILAEITDLAKSGYRVGDIGFAIDSHVRTYGYSVVRKYIGHGVGRELHEDPEVPNFGTAGRGARLYPGMTIAIEPMVNIGTHSVKEMPDGWCVKTADGKLSAHYEHTVLITDGEPILLTKV